MPERDQAMLRFQGESVGINITHLQKLVRNHRFYAKKMSQGINPYAQKFPPKIFEKSRGEANTRQFSFAPNPCQQ